METWMVFKAAEAEYLERIRDLAEQRRVPRSHARPSRRVRTTLAAVLVALAERIAPAAREAPAQEAPLPSATRS